MSNTMIIKKPSTKMNLIYSITYQFLNIAVQFVTTPYISRIFSEENIGLFSYTSSIPAYFLLFGNLGMATYAQLVLAKERDDIQSQSRMFFEILIARSTTMILCIISYAVFIIFTNQYKAVYLVLGLSLLASCFDITWFFQANERFNLIAIRNMLVRVISTVMIFLLIKHNDDLIVYIIILYGSTLLGNLSIWFGIKKWLVKINYRTLRIKQHYIGCMVYFLPTLATISSATLDKIVLGIVNESKAENGFYEQATKIENMIILVTNAYNIVMRPRISYLDKIEAYDEIKQRLVFALRLTTCFAIAVFFGLNGIAKDFVASFFGPGWDKVALLLNILSITILLKVISNCLLEQYYVSTGKMKYVTKIIVIGTVINTIANFALIPFWGSIGACISTVISEAIILFIVFKTSTNIVSIANLLKKIFKYVISGFIMFIYIILTKLVLSNVILCLLIQVVGGAIIYIIVLIIIKDDIIIKETLILKNTMSKKFKKYNGKNK